MVEHSSESQYRHWRRKQVPPVERVRDGLWSIPVPMPGGCLLAYALELPDGIALVDAGWPGEKAWRALADGLAEIGFQPRHVRAVLATHIHTDHFGLAGRIREESGATLFVHPIDAAWGSGTGPADRTRTWPEQRVRFGFPEDGPGADDAGREWREVYRTRPDVLVEDGALLDLPGWRLRALWTPGHSPGHVCYHDEERALLFGGDHVLPKITPHVRVSAVQRADPLGDYLRSLAAVRDLAVDEVLPGHEYRYAALRERVDELIGHHEKRLAEIEWHLATFPGSTCWQLTRSLTWSASGTPSFVHSRSAARETYAHLILLAARGLVEASGADPERWWVRS